MLTVKQTGTLADFPIFLSLPFLFGKMVFNEPTMTYSYMIPCGDGEQREAFGFCAFYYDSLTKEQKAEAFQIMLYKAVAAMQEARNKARRQRRKANADRRAEVGSAEARKPAML